MDDYTLKMTDEALTDLLVKDPFKRTESVLSLVKWINQIKDSKVISVEGNWGSGKTVAVKQLEIIHKDPQVIEKWYEKHRDKYRDLKIDDYKFDSAKITYYNAWENDSSEFPLLNFVYNLALSSGLEIKKKQFAVDIEKILKDIFSVAKIVRPELAVIDFLSKYIKVSDTKENELFDHIIGESDVQEVIKKFVERICGDKKLVIVVDELDRCRPDFALKLIESVKHYFNIDKIITMLVINRKEMCNIVKKYYGNTFESNEYLDKIIDLHLQLPELDKRSYLLYLLGDEGYNAIILESMLSIIKKYNLDMRQINRFLGTINSIFPADVLNGKSGIAKYFDPDDSDHIINYFMRSYMVVYLTGIRLFDNEQYESLIRGSGVEAFSSDYSSDYNAVESCLHLEKIARNANPKDGANNITSMIYYKCFCNKQMPAGYKEIENFVEENIPIVMNTCNLLTIVNKYQY